MPKHFNIPGIYRIIALLMFIVPKLLFSQEEPPRPMQVSTYQHLSFGAFINGTTGGTVTIEPGGSRTLTGDIIPVFMGFQYHPAIFEVEANPGVVINLMPGPDVQLTGSNGGTLNLHITATQPVSPFINTTHPPFRTQVLVGGSLIIGNNMASPPGEYTGSFYITFIQE